MLLCSLSVFACVPLQLISLYENGLNGILADEMGTSLALLYCVDDSL